MGTVYEAEQTSLKRKVALKVLSPHMRFFRHSADKFQREAEAGGRLHHSGIVAVYAVGEEGSKQYIAQELVEEGRTLAQALRDLQNKDLPPTGHFRNVANLVLELADALEHAHQSGVIHRDIKPSNILLTFKATLRLREVCSAS